MGQSDRIAASERQGSGIEVMKNLLRIPSACNRSQLPNCAAPCIKVARPSTAINGRAIDISGAIEHWSARRVAAVRWVACEGVKDGFAPTVTGIAATWAPAGRLRAYFEHSANCVSAAVFGRPVEVSVFLHQPVGVGTVKATRLGAKAVEHRLIPDAAAVR